MSAYAAALNQKVFTLRHGFDRGTCLNIMLMLLLFANDTRFITILLLSHCHDCCNGSWDSLEALGRNS